jgi:hypothetical protein
MLGYIKLRWLHKICGSGLALMPPTIAELFALDNSSRFSSPLVPVADSKTWMDTELHFP